MTKRPSTWLGKSNTSSVSDAICTASEKFEIGFQLAHDLTHLIMLIAEGHVCRNDLRAGSFWAIHFVQWLRLILSANSVTWESFFRALLLAVLLRRSY